MVDLGATTHMCLVCVKNIIKKDILLMSSLDHLSGTGQD